MSTLYALSFRRYCSVDAFVLGLGQNIHKQTEEYKEVLMTMKKKLFTIALALCMILTMVPGGGIAQ